MEKKVCGYCKNKASNIGVYKEEAKYYCSLECFIRDVSYKVREHGCWLIKSMFLEWNGKRIHYRKMKELVYKECHGIKSKKRLIFRRKCKYDNGNCLNPAHYKARTEEEAYSEYNNTHKDVLEHEKSFAHKEIPSFILTSELYVRANIILEDPDLVLRTIKAMLPRHIETVEELYTNTLITGVEKEAKRHLCSILLLYAIDEWLKDN